MKTELSLLCLSVLVWAAEGKIRVPGPGPGDPWPWSNRPNVYLPIINYKLMSIFSNNFLGASITFSFQDFKAVDSILAKMDRLAK